MPEGTVPTFSLHSTLLLIPEQRIFAQKIADETENFARKLTRARDRVYSTK